MKFIEDLLGEVFIFTILALMLLTSCKPVTAQEVPPEPAPVAATAEMVTLKVPTKVPAYNVVTIFAAGGGTHHDILVFTTYKGQTVFVPVYSLKAGGNYAFTGPPGKYSIRATAYNAEFGFLYSTASMEIVGADGGEPVVVKPIDPEVPPVPVDPGSPATGPPAPKRFGFGPVVYEVLVKDRPPVAAVAKLKANFQWGVDSKLELAALIAEMKKRNDALVKENPSLKRLMEEWIGNANFRIQEEIIKTIDEHKEAFSETLEGIEAAYGK